MTRHIQPPGASRHPWDRFPIRVNNVIATYVLRWELQREFQIWMGVRLLDMEENGGLASSRIRKFSTRGKYKLAQRMGVTVQTVERWMRRARAIGWLSWNQDSDEVRYVGINKLSIGFVESEDTAWRQEREAAREREKAERAALIAGPRPEPMSLDVAREWVESDDGIYCGMLAAQHYDPETDDILVGPALSAWIASGDTGRLGLLLQKKKQYLAHARREYEASSKSRREALAEATIEAPGPLNIPLSKRGDMLKRGIPATVLRHAYAMSTRWTKLFPGTRHGSNAALHDLVQTWATLRGYSREFVASLIGYTSRSAKRWNVALNTKSFSRFLVYDLEELVGQIGGKLYGGHSDRCLLEEILELDRSKCFAEYERVPGPRAGRVARMDHEGRAALAVQVSSAYDTDHIDGAVPDKSLRKQLNSTIASRGYSLDAGDTPEWGAIGELRLRDAKASRRTMSSAMRAGAGRYLLSLILDNAARLSRWVSLPPRHSREYEWAQHYVPTEARIHFVPTKPSDRILKSPPVRGSKLELDRAAGLFA